MAIDKAIFERARTDLNDPEVRVVCEEILKYIDQADENKLQHLTYSYFYKFAPNKRDAVAKSIHYLSGVIAVLSVRFEYITDEEKIFEITRNDIQEQEATQRFYDPSGNRVDRDEFYSRIYPYFLVAREKA